MAQPNDKRNIAVLIDGDSAEYKVLKKVLAEIEKYGRITICRAYGDWTQDKLSAWQEVTWSNTIKQVQVPLSPTGKNMTDVALVIDAMDFLHLRKVDGFCIVGSDSDYIALCRRIREDGLLVMAVGHQQTRDELINECDIFIHFEDLKKPTKKQNKPAAKTSNIQSKMTKDHQLRNKLLNRLCHTYNLTKGDDDWVGLGEFGKKMHELYPAFETKKYGHKTLSSLMEDLSKYIELKKTKKTGMYIRFRK